MADIRLTENQWEVLANIAYLTETNAYGARGQGQFTPLDLGGHNGSHHSTTLAALVRKGLVEHKKSGYDWGQAPRQFRGSKVYRATALGIETYNIIRKEAQREQ